MSEKLQADWDREIEERMADYESKAKDAALWVKIKAVVPNPEGLEELIEVSGKLIEWLGRLEATARIRANDKRFLSLAEANEKDAENYAATKSHIIKARRACGIEVE